MIAELKCIWGAACGVTLTSEIVDIKSSVLKSCGLYIKNLGFLSWREKEKSREDRWGRKNLRLRCKEL